MIINCDPGKTELIGFGTAENDETLLPMSFHLGSNKIKFVEKTKVLGLIMDRKLTYIEHAKDINRKVLGRWATICKYTNRNWGFRQHVIVRLIEVLIYSRIHYAGTVWINNRSIKEVESAWYRTIKAALGAVFGVTFVDGFQEFLDENGLLSRELSREFNRFKRPDFLHLNWGGLAKLGCLIRNTVILRRSGGVDRRTRTRVDGTSYRDVAASRVEQHDGYQPS